MKLESKIVKVGTHSSQEIFVPSSKKAVEIGSIIKFKFSRQRYDKFYEGRVDHIDKDGRLFIELV